MANLNLKVQMQTQPLPVSFYHITTLIHIKLKGNVSIISILFWIEQSLNNRTFGVVYYLIIAIW